MLKIKISALKTDKFVALFDGERVSFKKNKVSKGAAVRLKSDRMAVIPDNYEFVADIDAKPGKHILQIKQVDVLDGSLWFLKALNPISGLISALADKNVLGLDGEKANSIFELNIKDDGNYEISFKVCEETYKDEEFNWKYTVFEAEKGCAFCKKLEEFDDVKYVRRWKTVNIISNLLLTLLFSLIIYFYTTAAAQSIKVVTCVIGVIVTVLVFILTMINSIFAVPKSRFINKTDEK